MVEADNSIGGNEVAAEHTSSEHSQQTAQQQIDRKWTHFQQQLTEARDQHIPATSKAAKQPWISTDTWKLIEQRQQARARTTMNKNKTSTSRSESRQEKTRKLGSQSSLNIRHSASQQRTSGNASND